MQNFYKEKGIIEEFYKTLKLIRKEFSKNEDNEKINQEGKKTMKNTNFKINKTKLVAKVMLLVLLLASALNLGACSRVSQVNRGQYYRQALPGDHGVSIMAVSNTNEFDLNNISFQLYIGLHLKSYSLMDWITTDKNELLTKTYEVSEIPDIDSYKNFYYIVYASNSHDLDPDDDVLNYAYILKEIPFEESFKDGAYNFTKMPFSSDYYYNHSEIITIPKECVLAASADEYKDLIIGVVLAERIDNSEKKYRSASDMYSIVMGLGYSINDNGTVLLSLTQMK